IGEEERHIEEEEEDELYRDVNINQGMGIRATLEVEDSHVTLILVNPDGHQQSSSVSSQFVTSMLSLTLDVVSAIPGIIQRYMDQRMNEAVKVAAVNEQLEAEVLTRSSYSSNTSYAVAADLSQMELKKILIENMEGNKRQDDDADKDKEPFARPDQGSKRCREGKEPESASALTKTATRSTGRSTQGSRSRQASVSESALAEEPMQTTSQIEEPSNLEFDTGADDQPIVQSFQHPEWFSQQQKPLSPDHDWNKTVPAIHGSIQPWISKLAKQTDSRSSFNELMDTPLDLFNFLINRFKVDTLTPELLAGPTYELMKGSCKSLVELEYHLEEIFKATTDQLDWVNPEGQQYPHNLLKPLPLIPNNRGRRVIPFEHFINNDLKYLREAASSRKYITSITKTKAADYEHIKWIENLVPRTMWIKEPTGYDKHALWKSPIGGVNVSSSMVLLLTGKACGRPSTGCRKLPEEAQPNEAGYNKDKKNRLMRIDKLHKFCDGTLIDVRTALDDRLKGIRMRYLPQTIWRKSDKDRASAMIQAIDKRLKTRRIMRSLERFVGGRLYEGEFRMLQRTI
nr:hypothetical protein [Tanacetum cinerariifolium]